MLYLKEYYLVHNDLHDPNVFKNVCQHCGNITDDDSLVSKQTIPRDWDSKTPN